MKVLKQVQHTSPGNMQNGAGSLSHPTMRIQGKTGDIAIIQNTSVGLEKQQLLLYLGFEDVFLFNQRAWNLNK